MDAVDVLRTPVHLRPYSRCLQLVFEHAHHTVDVPFSLLALGREHSRNLAVLVRFDVLEGQVLQQPLQLPHTQSVSEGRVDVESLLRDSRSPFIGHEAERSHVVQAVGQLDDNDPHVFGHRHQHLADACGPRGVVRVLYRARLVLAPDVHQLGLRELRHAVDELGDFFPEALRDLPLRNGSVLDHVVQQRGGQAGVVETQVGQVESGVERVLDEWLAGLAELPGVGFRGEPVRLFDCGHFVVRQVLGRLV